MSHNADRLLLRQALERDPKAVRALVKQLTPVIQARVARVLLRREGAARGRDVRQEVEDLAQEVFVGLFSQQAKTLRAWDPERGMSLRNFAGLVAERQTISILRSGKRSPWTEDPTLDEQFSATPDARPTPEAQTASRDLYCHLLDALRMRLSPLGLQLFEWLFIEQRTVEEICQLAHMKPGAVYAWRSRLAKLARQLVHDLSESGMAKRTPDRGREK